MSRCCNRPRPFSGLPQGGVRPGNTSPTQPPAASPFDPTTLFGEGVGGGWFDFTDLSTLEQDAHTPVTAHGQPVGVAHDKSRNALVARQSDAGKRPTTSAAGALIGDFTDDELQVPVDIDGQVVINTPSGYYLSEIHGGPKYGMPLNGATQVVVHEGTLSAAQKAAIPTALGTSRVFAVYRSNSTLFENMVIKDAGPQIVTFIGANGQTVTKTVVGTAPSINVASDGLTAPVTIVFPATLVDNTSLTDFTAPTTGDLQGALPSFATNTALKTINLSNNQLTGGIPSIATNTALTTFDVSGNRFTGNLPSITTNTALKDFGASINQLTGSIPSLTTNTALVNIYLGENQLTGSIPSLATNTKLDYVGLYENQLTGNIPSLAANTVLTTFAVYNNQLTGYDGGGIPRTLGDFSANGNAFTQAAVDAILADFVAANKTTGTRILDLHGGTNAAPSAAGHADKATLTSRGWTVTTN